VFETEGDGERTRWAATTPAAGAEPVQPRAEGRVVRVLSIYDFLRTISRPCRLVQVLIASQRATARVPKPINGAQAATSGAMTELLPRNWLMKQTL
jgi:hypothetical protein